MIRNINLTRFPGFNTLKALQCNNISSKGRVASPLLSVTASSGVDNMMCVSTDKMMPLSPCLHDDFFCKGRADDNMNAAVPLSFSGTTEQKNDTRIALELAKSLQEKLEKADVKNGATEAERATILEEHKALNKFLKSHPGIIPPDIASKLDEQIKNAEKNPTDYVLANLFTICICRTLENHPMKQAD